MCRKMCVTLFQEFFFKKARISFSFVLIFKVKIVGNIKVLFKGQIVVIHYPSSFSLASSILILIFWWLSFLDFRHLHSLIWLHICCSIFSCRSPRSPQRVKVPFSFQVVVGCKVRPIVDYPQQGKWNILPYFSVHERTTS